MYYLCQPKTQAHARILNTGLARSMATTTKPYKLFHVPTHRVGVYLCQPGTQRHAQIRNTGGVTTITCTCTKYFQADQLKWVPFLLYTQHTSRWLPTFHSKYTQRTSMATNTSLQVHSAYIHGYQHITPSTLSVHPWLTTHHSKYTQSTSMATNTSTLNIHPWLPTHHSKYTPE